MFDTFQDEYFEKNPEKWNEVEANMMKEAQEREKKMIEYKNETLKKMEIDDKLASSFGEEDDGQNSDL